MFTIQSDELTNQSDSESDIDRSERKKPINSATEKTGIQLSKIRSVNFKKTNQLKSAAASASSGELIAAFWTKLLMS